MNYQAHGRLAASTKARAVTTVEVEVELERSGRPTTLLVRGFVRPTASGDDEVRIVSIDGNRVIGWRHERCDVKLSAEETVLVESLLHEKYQEASHGHDH